MTAHAPDTIVAEFLADREIDSVDLDYFEELVREVTGSFETLRSDLEVCIDREWHRLDAVERAVLLIGAYEMRHCQEIPYRVVINEGVELCKMFGTVEGHRYVNGVLDRLARELRGPEIAARS